MQQTFKLRIYTNGQQATLPKDIMQKHRICQGDYVTLKAYDIKRNDYVIFTSKVSKRGIITFPSWAVRSLWLKPESVVEVELLKVYKVGGGEDGDTQPNPDTNR